jgi:hypothetical protein
MPSEGVVFVKVESIKEYKGPSFILDRSVVCREWITDDADWDMLVEDFSTYEQALFTAHYISTKYQIVDAIFVMQRLCCVYRGGTKVALYDH